MTTSNDIFFELNDDFISRYKGKQPKWGPIGYITYKRTYSRDLGNGQTEEFWQTLKRVVEGVFTIQRRHCFTNRLPWSQKKAQNSAQKMFELMWQFKFTPPGRGLWMMGSKYVYDRGGAALMNCFGLETRIITKNGVYNLEKFNPGDIISLWSPTKKDWVDGTFNSFGKQNLNNIVISPNNRGNKGIRMSFRATKNHRWLLKDESITMSLKVGDIIKGSKIDFKENVEEWTQGLIHGMIFGDGTKAYKDNPLRYKIQLWGKKEANADIFIKHNGYISTTYKPTTTITIDSEDKLKELPANKSISYIKGFIEGYLRMDGYELKNRITLKSVDKMAIEFVKNNAIYNGLTVVGERTPRKPTSGFGTKIQYSITLAKNIIDWKVNSISASNEEPVFCFTVPEIGNFTLENGISTGNCAFVGTDNINVDFAEPFCFLMDMSMLGVGVGGDTRGAGKITFKEPKIDAGITLTVEDSREGWVDLLRTLLNSYVGLNSNPEHVDFSKVRKAGEPIKSFGGISGGPEPLMEMYNTVKSLLDSRIGQKISSSDIVDIFNLISRCVVSGNVRRSATIMLGDYKDAEFLELKNPEKNKDALMHHRWASNNSILAEVGMDYTEVAKMTAKNGEPGFIWLDNSKKFSRMNGIEDNKDYRVQGVNPCGEQDLESFEACNLVETYPSNHETLEEWIETLKYAYMYAKTVTLISSHSEKANSIMLRNRRIGCSISGIVQAFKKFGRRNFLEACKDGYDSIQEWDKVYSDWLCIPRSIKTTTVKPSGTISLLAGVTPGIHYPMSEYYIRNVRFQEGSKLLEQLKENGYKVEKDKYSLNTWVVSFPVKEEYFDRCVSDVSMWEQLENAAQIQKYWSDNQVSVTISFDEKDAKDIKNALELYETRLKGVSFLPKKDHGYEQAPYIPIDETTYTTMVEAIKKFKIKGDTHEVTEKGCESDRCVVL